MLEMQTVATRTYPNGHYDLNSSKLEYESGDLKGPSLYKKESLQNAQLRESLTEYEPSESAAYQSVMVSGPTLV
ncbi:hypothetical protein T265_09916 [Opisthorchis viverrini]|uniref:Uncharacterized protein n=1 Tax=Opisthorchis viverrini TaxID=6198 RepID=A0A074Z435_OPIVI|nr:hypothetical protein T265_09916 [Opisthorchis viverrini]KER21851.1 hypothetical protein T265_09916 [Opisthorchis viverrini]